jgi:hypothetical protein
VTTVEHVVYVIIGIVMIVIVIDASIRTFVLPRGVVVRFTVTIFQLLRAAFNVLLRTRKTYESSDRLMALYAPLALLAVPIVSLIVVFVAYAFIYTGLENHGWRDAFITSGSSLLTLGFERPPDFPSTLVVFSEALVGLSLLALVISYLPVIYNAFSRREVAVTDLSIRAGNPPTPLEFLTRAHLTGFLYDMDGFWSSWMAWFTEVQETHTSYGSLPLFRSPNPHRSWVIASGAVLDTASIRLAALDMPWTPQPALMIRSGFLALREIAGFFGFDYDEDPAPDDPISITREEFDDVIDKLAARGVPVKEDREQAWADFSGWRVNYDAVLLSLAAFVNAPYAPWVSDRSPRVPMPLYPRGRKRREIANRGGRHGSARPEKDPPL